MEPNQNQPPQSAQAYYNKTRKRSFFFSRIGIVISMTVLVIALAINISVLYSQDRTNLQSHASTPPTTKDLPVLPKGCDYQKTNKGFKVVCATEAPSPTVTTNINVQLPQLPPQCSLQTSNGGNKVQCSKAVPIPTVAVQLPPLCTATQQANTISCQQQGKNFLTPLPSLPGGCVYKQAGNDYFVSCNSI
ncbi:MAG: hypothetical protein ACR2LN_07440 [Candidatus Levyibacteriota bacterium]